CMEGARFPGFYGSTGSPPMTKTIETVEVAALAARVAEPPPIVVTYWARVRVTVYSQDGSRRVVRERSGGHRGFGPTVGQAVEDCIKTAETDATKRAFVTFGNLFGVALYDREQRNVEKLERRQVAAPSGSQVAAFDEGFEPSDPRRQITSPCAWPAPAG